MRTSLSTLALLGAVTVLMAAPIPAEASQLSEALHAFLGQDDYAYYTYPPGVEYAAPGYGYYYGPGYSTVPGYVYYGGPYYQYTPYRAWYGGARHWDRGHHDRYEHRR